jgi:hypothetical protein
VKPERTYVGPILTGLLAILFATLLSRGGLLIPAVLGVGSWWLYKFWPKKTAPEDVEARAFLERMENPPVKKDEALKGSENDSQAQPLDVFRDLRL